MTTVNMYKTLCLNMDGFLSISNQKMFEIFQAVSSVICFLQKRKMCSVGYILKGKGDTVAPLFVESKC